jgi:CRISPR/Cas system-associated endoribonuclease Cas2
VKDPQNEIPVKIIEQAILDVAAGFKRINSSRLTKRAIIVLIQDSVGMARITKGHIEEILDAATNLDKRYLK